MFCFVRSPLLIKCIRLVRLLFGCYMHAHAQSEGTIANTDDLLHCCHLTKGTSRNRRKSLASENGTFVQEVFICTRRSQSVQSSLVKYSQSNISISALQHCSLSYVEYIYPRCVDSILDRELEVAGSNPSCLRVKAVLNLFRFLVTRS